MAMNFPNVPVDGQIYTDAVSGAQYVYQNPAWKQVSAAQLKLTAQARNRVCNPAMQISQENGDTASLNTSYYPADQWYVSFPGPAVLQSRRSPRANGVTPNGSQVIGFSVTTAKSSLAASDYSVIATQIEGVRISDFLWGTAAARPAVLRFCIYATYAGTFNVALNRTPAYDRYFVKSFTVAAGEVNTYKYVTVVVPADTTAGTWGSGNAGALELTFPIGVGSTYGSAVDGVWTAGNKYQVTGSTNGLATLSNSFSISDVGLYLDDQATGAPPPWVMPDEVQELAACQRYWLKLPQAMVSGYHGAGQPIYNYVAWPQTMRTPPAMGFLNLTVNNCVNLVNNASEYTGGRASVTVNATGGAWIIFDWTLSARM